MTTANKCLLIVDDESDLRDMLSEILGMEGYRIVTAADGEEAIRLLGKETFDAALLDIQMPKEDGFEVLRHIAKHYPQTKSIMLTGYTDLKSAVEAKRLGAVDYITKPYKLQTVIEALRRVLSA